MQQATSVARIAYVPMMPYNSLACLLYVSTHQPIKRQNPFLSVLTLTSSMLLVLRDCRLKIPTRIHKDGSEVPCALPFMDVCASAAGGEEPVQAYGLATAK